MDRLTKILLTAAVTALVTAGLAMIAVTTLDMPLGAGRSSEACDASFDDDQRKCPKR